MSEDLPDLRAGLWSSTEQWTLEMLRLEAAAWKAKMATEALARAMTGIKTEHDRQMLALLDRFPAAAQERSWEAIRCQCPRCQEERMGPEPVPGVTPVPLDLQAINRNPDRRRLVIPWATAGLRVSCSRCLTIFPHDALAKESWAQCPECGEVTMIVVDRWSVPVARPELMPRPQPTQVQVEAPSEPPVRLRPERQFE